MTAIITRLQTPFADSHLDRGPLPESTARAGRGRDFLNVPARHDGCFIVSPILANRSRQIPLALNRPVADFGLIEPFAPEAAHPRATSRIRLAGSPTKAGEMLQPRRESYSSQGGRDAPAIGHRIAPGRLPRIRLLGESIPGQAARPLLSSLAQKRISLLPRDGSRYGSKTIRHTNMRGNMEWNGAAKLGSVSSRDRKATQCP